MVILLRICNMRARPGDGNGNVFKDSYSYYGDDDFVKDRLVPPEHRQTTCCMGGHIR